MMLFMVVMAVAVLGAHAAPQQAPIPEARGLEVTPVPIISQTQTDSVDGSFNYRYNNLY